MALIIEAPNEVFSLENNENIKLFLAGGISNCTDWQSDIIKQIKDMPLVSVYNPRRKNFPIHDLNAAEEQITWEYNQLKNSDMIVFWFAKGSINPIVLYELGRWGNSSNTPIIVGIDPEYERKSDVIIQTRLSRPEIIICESFKEFKNTIEEALNTIINTINA